MKLDGTVRKYIYSITSNSDIRWYESIDQSNSKMPGRACFGDWDLENCSYHTLAFDSKVPEQITAYRQTTRGEHYGDNTDYSIRLRYEEIVAKQSELKEIFNEIAKAYEVAENKAENIERQNIYKNIQVHQNPLTKLFRDIFGR